MVDDSQLRRLAADLRGAQANVGSRARTVLRKTAYDVQATAKRIAPRDPARPPKDPSRPVTGNLRNSITHSDARIGTSGSLVIEVGPTAAYGKFLEMGTSRMPPRPFMGPAADQHTPAFEQAMQQLGLEGLSG